MNSNRILVVRNDKLGDFMLAWPALAQLKQQLPDAHITALVPAYTAPMAELCPWIDALLIDEGESAWALSRKLRAARFDAMLTLFSTSRVAIAGCLARIPYRLAPATKLAQLCYNQRLPQRRSRSEKPEYAYNLDLSLRLIADHHARPYWPSESRDGDKGDYLPETIGRPLLDTGSGAEGVLAELGLEGEKRLLFIHPGSGGSANNLRPEQYAQLANRILERLPQLPLAFVISAGPGEEATAREVVAAIHGPAVTYSSSAGLAAFTQLLQHADLFISGSTGPLHIAAALNRPTAAFYPRHRSATPLRWQTLNAPGRRLVFTPPPNDDERNVQSIDVEPAAEQIAAALEAGFA